MELKFDNSDFRFNEQVFTVAFDIKDFEGTVVVQVKTSTLLKYIEEEKLNWGYPLEPDDYVQICSPLTHLQEHPEDVLKQYLIENFK